MPLEKTAIVVSGVRKAYGATIALDDMAVEVRTGTVHALLGENGAGKSTLVKMLSGLVTPDAGSLRVFGESISLKTPLAAQRHGIQTAFQEMTLLRNMSVLDNMLIPRSPLSPLGMVRRRQARRDVGRHFEELGLAGFDLDDEIGDLDLAIRQKIEIARAVFRRPRILLLDEPTSALSGPDVDWMGAVIRREKARGTTVIFISHRLREVRDFCDDLTILRSGRHIASGHVRDFADEDVVRMIAGRSLIHSFPPRGQTRHRLGTEVLAAHGMGTAGKLREASFRLREGEILGIAGLQGMGQLDLFLALFGERPVSRGHLAVDGRKVVFTSPGDAISARIGISLVPEERKTEGLFLKLTGTQNATIPVIERFTRFGIIDRAKEAAAVRAVFGQVNVAERAEWMPAESFSGGNQQKIAIAKWLLSEARVLLVYDPTRGIDVGTKNEIYQLLRAYAEAGGAVIFYSTEIPELVHLTDRTLVFYAGRIAAELAGDQLTEEHILAAALGSAPDSSREKLAV
ncbi:sugar ABC transporter ATP-binding protein [Ancylobacter amanitiformis]|uniref:Ribose transport system ATP-binding protein n=1 Tax=Ancylobacter amanitiformis TaxID=217069 RepID=A0ABU0LKX3_9HYPH|nr:sugar ABC transporter ATP-binding protein [Ancylobacter amanitiformis]MDQ0509350.1 ribose transport system ATP-binding protein [Ancylobacter amanitiformis]